MQIKFENKKPTQRALKYI